MITETAKTRPILFSDPMVRAILGGSKRHTRRVIKPQPPACCIYEINGNQNKAICLAGPDADVPERPWFVPPYVNKAQHFVECPYGKPGDRLWVRETFAVCADSNIFYRADGKPDPWDGVKWKPSIHMPRLASRITLEITGVRVERLNDISNADCIAEGIEPIGNERDIGKCCGKNVKAQAGRIDGRCSTVRQLYSELWVNINGKGSWSINPWVWVVEFRKVN